MSDDDPFVERSIRTPNATITFKGTLSQVDDLYRTTNKALLASGKYTIPKPDSNPWQQYTPPSDDNPDHLRRRITHLENLLRQSESHNAVQDLRHDNHVLTLERDEWRTAFTDLNTAVVSARTSLADDPEPNLYNAVALTYLSI